MDEIVAAIILGTGFGLGFLAGIVLLGVPFLV